MAQPGEKAREIIERLGGFSAVAEHLGYNVSSVYKWTYPKARHGRDGIPRAVFKPLLELADKRNVSLNADDLLCI